MRVRHASGEGEEAAWTDVEFLTAALEHVLAFQDLEQLILVLMDVWPGVEERRQFLPDAERSARGLDQDGASSKCEVLAIVFPECVATNNRFHARNITQRRQCAIQAWARPIARVLTNTP